MADCLKGKESLPAHTSSHLLQPETLDDKRSGGGAASSNSHLPWGTKDKMFLLFLKHIWWFLIYTWAHAGAPALKTPRMLLVPVWAGVTQQFCFFCFFFSKPLVVAVNPVPRISSGGGGKKGRGEKKRKKKRKKQTKALSSRGANKSWEGSCEAGHPCHPPCIKYHSTSPGP